MLIIDFIQFNSVIPVIHIDTLTCILRICNVRLFLNIC